MTYNKNRIRELLYNGVNKGYSHMVIVCDKWDYEDFVVYVKEEENIDVRLGEYRNPNTLYSITEIYNYEMDLESQLKEDRAYHPNLDIKTKQRKINEFKNNAELIDLHVHSCYSDGELTPDELIKLAVRKGIYTLSITDHDTLLGNKNISKNSDYVDFLNKIPGIELTAKVNTGRMHILGYGIDINNKYLNDKMLELMNNSINNVLAMLYQLNKDYGITFSKEEINNLINSKRNIGRPDISKLLVKYGYATNVNDAFKKYLVDVYEKTRTSHNNISPEECINLIKYSSGIPVLAHPYTLELQDKELLIEIRKLISMGLKGIEVYHSNHNVERQQFYMSIAEQYGLLYSGGSDYHGPTIKPDIELGTGKSNNLKIKELSIVSYLNSRK